MNKKKTEEKEKISQLVLNKYNFKYFLILVIAIVVIIYILVQFGLYIYNLINGDKKYIKDGAYNIGYVKDKKEKQKIEEKFKDNLYGTGYLTEKEIKDIDFLEIAKKQLQEPKIGEQIVEIKFKNYNEILKIKLLQDSARFAYNDIIKMINENIYTNVNVKVEKEELLIDNNKNEKYNWEKHLKEESSINAIPIKGALLKYIPLDVYYRKGNGFKILLQDSNKEGKEKLLEHKFPESIITAYEKYGGNIFDYEMASSIIGQVYSGIEMFEKIKKDAKEKGSEFKIEIEYIKQYTKK